MYTVTQCSSNLQVTFGGVELTPGQTLTPTQVRYAFFCSCQKHFVLFNQKSLFKHNKLLRSFRQEPCQLCPGKLTPAPSTQFSSQVTKFVAIKSILSCRGPTCPGCHD